MKGTLTLAHLKGLLRLYRAEVNGAAEQLGALLQDRWDELPVLLGSSLQQVTRLLKQEDALGSFARAIEQTSADATATRSLTSCKVANTAAQALARASVLREGGLYQLPIAPLRAALESWRGNGDIAFGDRGGVDLARLRALLRRCAGLDAMTVTLTDQQLILRYSTTRARGVICFTLRDLGNHDKVLVIPIAPRNALTARTTASPAVQAPDPWPADDAQYAASPQPPMPPMRPLLALVR